MLFSTLLVSLCAIPAALANNLAHRNPAHNLIAKRATASTVKSGYYAGWHVDKLPIDQIPWTKYTHMAYSFATTVPGGITLADSDKPLLQQFVAGAHAHGVKAMLSIGGWGGSVHFSDNFVSSSKRAAFISSIISTVKQYKLDGLDFDWEFPTSSGSGSNTKSSDDTAHFVSFLKQLRADATGKNLILSVAAPPDPFTDASGNAGKDMSGFNVVDWIVIMNYNVYGPWSSTVGPNAPLADACAPAGKAQGSAVNSVSEWEKAGVLASKIVLGVASYGQAWSVKKSDAYSSGITIASYPPFDRNNIPAGDGSDDSGLWFFRGLVNGGWLTTQGTPANGIGYKFGSCSKTAYLYDPKKQVMITYDDAPAFNAKGAFIKSSKIRGFAVWEVAGDYNNILVNAITKGLTS